MILLAPVPVENWWSQGAESWGIFSDIIGRGTSNRAEVSGYSYDRGLGLLFWTNRADDTHILFAWPDCDIVRMQQIAQRVRGKFYWQEVIGVLASPGRDICYTLLPTVEEYKRRREAGRNL